MNASRRRPDFKGGLDPWVRLVVRRILSYLPSSRRTRGLEVRNFRRIVTSHIWCFRCDQLGHYAKDCKKFPPQGKRGGKSKRKKFHASAVVEEGVEDQQPQKRMTRAATREEKKDCFLVLALSGTITDAEHI